MLTVVAFIVATIQTRLLFKVRRSTKYRTIQNFGGTKFWRIHCLQNLADKILANSQLSGRLKYLIGCRSYNAGPIAAHKSCTLFIPSEQLHL